MSTSQKPLAIVVGLNDRTKAILALLKPRYTERGKTHDSTSRVEAASVFCDQNGHARAYSMWNCSRGHLGHTLECPRTFYRTRDVGAERVSRRTPREYYQTASPPAVGDCPFEIMSEKLGTLTLYCYHHLRTFIAFQPSEPHKLRVRSAVAFDAENPSLVLQYCTEGKAKNMPAPTVLRPERLETLVLTIDINLDEQDQFVANVSLPELRQQCTTVIRSRCNAVQRKKHDDEKAELRLERDLRALERRKRKWQSYLETTANDDDAESIACPVPTTSASDSLPALPPLSDSTAPAICKPVALVPSPPAFVFYPQYYYMYPPQVMPLMPPPAQGHQGPSMYPMMCPVTPSFLDYNNSYYNDQE